MRRCRSAPGGHPAGFACFDLGSALTEVEKTRSITADGKGTFEKSFRALEGGTEPIAVRELPDAGLGAQRIVAIVVGAFGLASVGAGIDAGGGFSSWAMSAAACAGSRV